MLTNEAVLRYLLAKASIVSRKYFRSTEQTVQNAFDPLLNNKQTL